MNFNRRTFIKSSMASSLVLPMASRLSAAERAEPHFFLHYSMNGGLDKLYTFDSRPLSMTEKKVQVNHILN